MKRILLIMAAAVFVTAASVGRCDDAAGKDKATHKCSEACKGKCKPAEDHKCTDACKDKCAAKKAEDKK